MAGGNDPSQQTPPPPTVPKPVNATPAQPPLETFAPPALAEPSTELAPPEQPASTEQAYFCLEANHPGTVTPRADHFDLSRMFTSNAKGAPTCPLCRRQVSAIPVDDTTKLPPSLQATADRLAAAERQR